MQTEGPRSMDPANQSASLTAAILAPMYEGLVRRAAGNSVAPLLATSWQASADGLDWRFTLRPGLRFHDQSPCDAAAVVAGFRRLLAPGSPLAAAGRFDVIAMVEPDGAQAVRFRLARPYADFLLLLATPQAWVVSPAAAAAGTLDRRACGTGPFQLAAWESGRSVLERRNRAYWGAAPAMDEIVFTWSSEPSVLYMALRSGETDVATPLSPVFADLARSDPALRLVRQDGDNIFWVALDVRLPPLGDLRVRQALNLATDRRALVSGLMSGFAHPLDSPLPASTPFHAGFPNALRYDPAAARALLAAAGFARGFDLDLAAQQSDEPLAEALQAMWREVGVRTRIHRLESGLYAAAAFAPPSAKLADHVGGVIASWASGSVADLELSPLFSSASAAPAGANLGFFSDPALDRLLEQASLGDDEAVRARLYGQAQRRIVQEAPAVLLYAAQDLAGLRRDIEGVGFIPGLGLTVADARAGPGAQSLVRQSMR